MERPEHLKISLGLTALLCLLTAAPAGAGGIITFTWDPQNNNNWNNSANWDQDPGAGDIPNDPNHVVYFDGNAGFGKDVDVQGATRQVNKIQVFGSDQYHFKNGTIGNWGDIYAHTQVIKFGSDVTYKQLGDGQWFVQNEGGMRMDATIDGSGKITVTADPAVPDVDVQLNAANPYTGIYEMLIGATTLGDALALQNARVELACDDPLDFNGFNPTFGGLSGGGALTLGGTALTLDGYSSTSTYSGALTSDGSGQIICANAGASDQYFSGSISNLGVFRVDSGNTHLSTGSFNFVSIFPSGAIDINGGELSIEDSAAVTLTSSNANGGTVNISGGKLSVGDAELYAARITSVSSGEVALSNTNLAAPGLIIGKNGSLNVTSTFAGKFTGAGSFKKIGTGALTLTGANTLTGEVIIDQGSVVLGSATTLQNTVVRLNVAGGLNINGFEPHIGGLSGSAALNMGNIPYTIGSDGTDGRYAGVLSANSSNSAVPSLIKTGSNVQELTGASSITGSFLVEGGKLRITGGGHFSALGDHKVAANSRLDVVEGSTLNPDQILRVGGLVYVEGATVDASSILLEESTNATFEALGGSTVTASIISVGRLDGNVAYLSAIDQGTSISATRLDLGPLGGNGIGIVGFDDSASGSFSDWVRLNTNQSVLSINGASLSTDRLITSGSPGSPVGTVGISDPATGSALTVGAQNGSSTFGGLVKNWFDGPGSITKTGTGSFTLSHANTYTGGTIVNGGTLVLGNSSGSATGTGGVAVESGGTLAGNGSAAGTSTIASGGTVGPGTSIGAMTLQDATFQAGSTLEIEFDMEQHDELIVSGAATLGGTLKIVDLNGIPGFGNSYIVLTAGTLAGEFDAVRGPAGTGWLAEYDYNAGTVSITRCNDADGDSICNDFDACPGFDDYMDIDNDGVPDACDTDCSGFPVHVSTAQELIDAIHCANGQPDANTIYLDADITLTAADNNDANQGPNGLPSVISPIVIEGQDHIIERDAEAPFFRIFRVSNSPSLGSLTVHDATLRNGLLDGSVPGDYRGGAAVQVLGAQLTMNNCILMDNNGFVDGGAILLRDTGATATLDTVILTGNKAVNSGSGGAIYLTDNAQLTVRNSVFAGNQAQNEGGAIRIVLSAGQATITNTIFSGNKGSNGIENNGTLTMVNCTLAGNRGNLGAGIYTGASGYSVLKNCLIWGNAVSTEPQVANDGTLDVNFTGLEGGMAGIAGTGTINDLGGVMSISSSRPVFVDPIAAANAPTTAGDYHLAPNSVAIDKGNNGLANSAGLTTDFEGDSRIIGVTVDMGADEARCALDGDDDGDGVCNAIDECPGFDDAADADSDGVPDGCDACPGFDNNIDADNDGVPDACDVCPGFDDNMDIDNDGVPDACDMDCSGFPVHVSTAQELIDAIHCANGQPDANTIYLDADITLTAADNNDANQGPNGLPSVISPIVIEGQDHIIERDAEAPFFRIFRVSNSPSLGSLTIHDATLRNGLLDGAVPGGYRGGAAVQVLGGQLTMNNCILMDNNGFKDGGAILLRDSGATATLDTVILTGNKAVNGGSGGAIYVTDNAQLTVRNSILAGNLADEEGSAIRIVRAAGQATLTNTIISGNHSSSGLADSFSVSNFGTLTMVNCTLSGNYGAAGGGSYTGAGGHSILKNCLIWGNAISTEPQVANDGTLDVNFTGLEGGMAGIAGAGTINDLGGVMSISSGGPVFVDPIGPANAPTTAGDYHLAPNSLAIDKGNNGLADSAGLTTDFEGDDRILEGRVDLGADEESTCPGDADDDGDGVCNAIDDCPGFDDAADADSDGVPDGCDACPGFDNNIDADNDGVPDACDACPGFDDNMDIDNDGVPDACDTDCSSFPVHVSAAQELIDAIHCANGQPDVNTIYLDADITLTMVDHVDQGANGLPTVATPIIIEGQGHTIERDTNAIDPFRLFHINSSGNLSLNEITLRKGRADLSATSGVRRGGAVMVASGEVTITNSVIADNQESAIYLLGPLSTATLDTVTMSGNNATAGGIGGAINAVIGGVLTIRNSIIVGNQQSYGGAIAMERADSQTIITNTIITGNDTTSTSGSGVYNNGSLSMVNSTIAGCFGNSSGGLFTGPDGVSTVVNSLIWGNLSNSGAQINTEGVLNISYSGIEGGVAGIIGSGVINDNGGNLSFNSSDSVFVDPVDPANAPTTDGNYHLAPNSVAIDQGSNAEAANAGLTTDIDGGDRIIGMTVDMGADEAACPQDGDDDGDGICNPLDICPLGNDSADADSDGVPDACDICPGFDDDTDADSDGVPDGCDACPGFDDAADADNDGVPNACDVCPGFDDTADADNDGVPDGCDICSGFDDTTDADTDGVPDGCDTCPGFDDAADADNDGVPDGCDACPDFDDTVDADNDGTPDACDACPGFDDSADADNDGVPDGCDICSGFDDTADADGDGVPDGCDVCPGFDDSADIDNDGVPDACDTDCSGFPVHVGTAQELVDAIQCANANPDTNTIFLDADITLAVVDNVTTGPNGLPAVVTPIVIEGQGHVIERDTNAAAPFRHFYVTSPGDLTINETTLQNGAADGTLSGHDSRGGAILVFSGHLTATNSVFAGNDGAGGGGAVYLRNNSAVATFDGVTMIGNIALNGGSGGAIEALQGGLLTIRNSVIAGNHGSFLGGAISMEGGNGQATITNTIISGNQGPNGIRNNGTLTLVNCTLAGNQGSTGGGLYTDASGHSTVINSVIWGNAAATESQVYCDGVLDVSYTGIEGGVAGISGAGAINDNGGNLDFGGADPVFIDPIDPASAPTTDGDYHLAANSAAVDAASNMEAVNAGLTTDFEGDDRIIGMTVDMGADEATCSLDGDDDGDGVCNSMDVCPAGDDTADMDSDGVPDGCDACAGFDDSLDADNDGVPDGCDICPGGDDTVDSDNNGTPDACDTACPGGAVGDVNTDGFVDTSDIVDFAAILLDPTMATADELCAADVNDDGVVDGLDVQGFVNLILAP